MTWKVGLTGENNMETANRPFAVMSNEAEQDEDEETLDYVSPYSVLNRTGFSILIQADYKTELLEKASKRTQDLSSKIYRVENNGSVQYRVESDIQDIVKENEDDFRIHRHKLKVRINHPNQKFEEVTGIDIDQTRITSFPLVSSGSLEGCIMVAEIKVENEKKLIVFSSPYRIVNHLDREIIASLECRSSIWNVKLVPGKNFEVPIDFVSGSVAFLDTPNYSTTVERVPMKEMFSYKNSREINAGSLNIIGEFTPLDLKKNVIEASLYPPIQVKNCCVKHLDYRIYSSSTVSGGVFTTLNPQQIAQESVISLSHKIYLQVKANGFEWSHQVLVHSPSKKDSIAKEVVLKDNEGKRLAICVYVFGDIHDPKDNLARGAIKIFLYTKTSIINETPYDLEYFVMDGRNQVKVPGQIPNNNLDLEKGKEGSSKLIMTGENKNLIISRKDTLEVSKKLNTVAVGHSIAELVNVNGTSLLELGVDVRLKPCDSDHHLLTKVITIHPRYVIVNQTDYKLEIKRESSEHLLLSLDKDERSPLYWSTWDAPKTKTKAKANEASSMYE